MYALDGVDSASWLAIVQAEMKTGYYQFDVFDFTMAMGRASLRSGLLWIQQMVTGSLWDKIILGNCLIIRATRDCRCWSVGLLLVSWLRGRF